QPALQEPQQAALPKDPARAAKPAAPVPPISEEPEPDVSEAFLASGQFYYVVNARGGAPAYASPTAEGTPLYTFRDATELKVVDVTLDRRWLKVVIPGERVGFVASSIVTSGVRAPK